MSTDPDWFRFLRTRPHFDEVNFWRPGVRTLNMAPGVPWLFLIRGTGQIWGYAYFSTFDYMPIGVAWDTFQEANGFSDFASFVRKIAAIKGVRENAVDAIGCAVLSRPIYLETPVDYHRLGRVYGPVTSYDARSEEGAYLLSGISLAQQVAGMSPIFSSYGAPVLVVPRLGQATFRIALERQYQMRCAVTGERTRPVLDAAHIKPFSLVREHSLTNGLLLRKDIHKLFDDGYVTVTPDRHFRVSDAIRDEFENGRDYYALDGKPIRTTLSVESQPAAEYLEWHSATRFKG